MPLQYYKISFWAKYAGTNSSPYVTVKYGTNGSLSQPISISGSGWNYYELKLPSSSGAIELVPFFGAEQVSIDELRLYPVNAQMTTYTHLPLYGLSSKTDINSISTSYVYDPLSRLYLILDQDKNILKRYTYQYK
jgi:hypothetical protein